MTQTFKPLQDSSGSCPQFEEAKRFMRDLVGQVPVDQNSNLFSLVTYNDRPNVYWYLHSYTNGQQLQSAISGIRYRGGRADLQSAIQLVRDDVFRQDRRPLVQNIIIFIVFGTPDLNAAGLPSLINQLYQQNVCILTRILITCAF